MINDDFDSMILAFSTGDDDSDGDFFPPDLSQMSMMNSVMSDTAKSQKPSNDKASDKGS
jgi:hypothetical protein